MLKENLVKLVQAAAENEPLMVKLQNSRSYDELRDIAQDHELVLDDLDAEEARRVHEVLSGQVAEPLKDEQLASFAGGIVIGLVGRPKPGKPLQGLQDL